jgi:hypothetical protein
MLGSAIEHGRDGKGLDGLLGFCAYLLKEDLKAYCSILGRLIPMQVSGDLTIGVKSVTIVSVPSGTFLTPAQIDGVSPPIAGPVATAPLMSAWTIGPRPERVYGLPTRHGRAAGQPSAPGPARTWP